MKYTSTINNVKCVEWGLTLSQAFLVELLVFSAAWAQRETVDGIDYYWVSRNKVLDEIPNAFKTADTVYRALIELNEKGVIEYKKLGRKDIFRLTDKGKEWIFKTSLSESKLGKKSELTQNSEINPSKLGKKSELNSEKNPTDKDTSTNKDTTNKESNSTKKKKVEKPTDVSNQVWSDFLELRKTKKAPLSVTAWNQAKKQVDQAMDKTGHSLEQVMTEWVLAGWTGFKCEWYLNRVGAKPQINRETDKLAVNNQWRQGESNIVEANTSIEDMFGGA